MPLPNHWSHSTLELYLSCPAAAAAKWNGEPAVVPENVRAGSALHEGIARYSVGCWETGKPRDKALMERIAAGYPGAVGEKLVAFAADVTWPWTDLRDAGEACPIEARYEATLPNGETFVGILDLAYKQEGSLFLDEDESSALIVDWKSARPPTWWDPEPPKQLLRYGWLYGQHHPEVKEWVLQYSSPGWERRWSWQRWHEEGDLAHVGRELAGLVDRIKADGELRPNPGEACGGCFYRAACPLCDKLLATWADVTSPPGEWVRQLQWLEAQAASRKAMLKAEYERTQERIWAETRQPELTGFYFGEGAAPVTYKARDRITLDTSLRNMGFEHGVRDLLGDPTKAAIEKAAKKLAAQSMDGPFMALWEKREGKPSVGLHKLAKDEDGQDPAPDTPDAS